MVRACVGDDTTTADIPQNLTTDSTSMQLSLRENSFREMSNVCFALYAISDPHDMRDLETKFF